MLYYEVEYLMLQRSVGRDYGEYMKENVVNYRMLSIILRGECYAIDERDYVM